MRKYDFFVDYCSLLIANISLFGNMFIFKRITDLQDFLQNHTNIGFVPTMGALHEGHISLIHSSSKSCQITVCSIFVNPTQFNDPKDFEKYPITLEKDIEMLEMAGCDVLFLPQTAEMYPAGIQTIRQYNLGYLNTILDGAFRPGHFNGVCAIVHQLLLAVKPQHLFLGEKDFQQCMVIRQLVDQEHLPVQVHAMATLRMKSGLAMSSRNQRLSENGLQKAASLYQVLKEIGTGKHQHSFSDLRTKALQKLENEGFETEYLVLADVNTLHFLDDFNQAVPMVVLIASKLESVRLIDNLRI